MEPKESRRVTKARYRRWNRRMTMAGRLMAYCPPEPGTVSADIVRSRGARAATFVSRQAAQGVPRARRGAARRGDFEPRHALRKGAGFPARVSMSRAALRPA